MPDIEEIIELLQRRAEELGAAVSTSVNHAVDHSKDRVHHILEDEELSQLPHRISASIITYWSALIDAVTAGGTLPALHLPTLSEISDRVQRIPILGSHALHERRPVLPPPPPPTLYERVLARLRAHPYLYSLLAALSLSLSSIVLTLHVSPVLRGKILHQAPYLRPFYFGSGSTRRGLPSLPRPRVSPDGKHRLEAVLVLGCDFGTYGREVAKALERKGFVVIASVSQAGEADDLERSGNGFIKAITLDTTQSPTNATAAFARSLNTALSLRYPLNSIDDPFHHVSASSPTLSLTSVVNCLPLLSYPYLSGPVEALPSESIAQAMNAILNIPLAIVKRTLPLLRAVHGTTQMISDGAQATVITCLPAPERFLGTPFSSSFKGIASNALVSALDVLRRELSLSTSSSSSDPSARRDIRIVNVDVGFLAPVCTTRHSRGTSHSPNKDAPPPTLQQIEARLPTHLRAIYAPALIANVQAGHEVGGGSKRKRLPQASELGEKIASLILRPWHQYTERTSVGAGVRTYYLASLLPTALLDRFFSFRQRMLSTSAGRLGASSGQKASDVPAGPYGAAAGASRPRRPLPLPGDPSSASTSSFEGDSEPVSGEDGAYSTGSEKDGPRDEMLGSDTILPAYAPSAPGSTAPPSHVNSEMSSPVEASQARFQASDANEGYDSQDEPKLRGSSILGDSFVRV